jgi:RNA polymerase sigma factor (sigma-70 family)
MAQPVPRDLVEAARRGSALEIERLLQAVWPVAYRLAYSVLADRQTAQDAAQESCVILYRTIASLRDPAAFRAWFYRIVVREASSLKRRHFESSIGKEPAQQQFEDQTTALDVWRALSTLPQHLRDVIVLRYFEDLPSREIASILRIHDGAVRFRLMVARRRLRPLLGDVFEDSSDSTSEVTTNAI